MKDKLITFETAKLAKEKGFKTDLLWYSEDGNIVRFPYFVNFQTGDNEDNRVTKFVRDALDRDGMSYDYSPVSDPIYYYAPTKSLLQKWLREEYGIHIEISRDEDKWKYNLYSIKQGNRHIPRGFKTYSTYEKALEAGLVEALKLIK